MTVTFEIVLLALLAYAWVGYPLALALVSRLRAPRCNSVSSSLPVSVSFLFSAHNEEKHIAARLKDLLSASEELRPSGVRCEILAGVDGSVDRTAEIARSLAAPHPDVHVLESPERRGKMRMVKDLVAAAEGEVLILTDANTFFRPGSPAQLLRHFADPAIGGVCGRLILKEPGGRRPESGVRSPEGSYWDWESHLKFMESGLDSCLGANGAIYAIRRELFWRDVPDNTVVDDFVIGMKVREAGRRMLYEPKAVAEEELPERAHEWPRRIRIGAGDFQALALCVRCLQPHYGAFSWFFWSHKVLRWCTPHIVITTVFLSVLHCSLSADHGSLSRLLLATCLGGVAAWVAGRMLLSIRPAGRGILSILLLWEHFVTMQAALFVGSLRYLRGDLKGHWARTPRSGS
jgi:cellulose synthase/poly-beta-1,6-N-acetylglucosamine synthase-like glycosyltransferase